MKTRVVLFIGLVAILLAGLGIYLVKSRSAQPLAPCVGACNYLLRTFDSSPETAYRLFMDTILDEIKTTVTLPEGYPQVGRTGTVSGDEYLHCIPGSAGGPLARCILLNDQNNYVWFVFCTELTARPYDYTIYLLPPWPWIKVQPLDLYMTTDLEPISGMEINLAIAPGEFRQTVDSAIRATLAKLGVVPYSPAPD